MTITRLEYGDNTIMRLSI